MDIKPEDRSILNVIELIIDFLEKIIKELKIIHEKLDQIEQVLSLKKNKI